MKETPEPRSPKGIASSIWAAPRIKPKKRLWNFVPSKERGQIAELSPKLKRLGFKSDQYKFGEYIGNLADIKEFAAMRGIEFVTVGAVKYKTGGAAC
jgi:hypothetical protein